MANLKVTLELDSQGYVRNIKAADDATKQFNKDAVNGAKDVDRAFDSLNGRSEKLIGVVNKLKTALVGAALVSFGRGAIQAADAINDLSEATDLSVGKILQLQEALQQSGGKAESAGKLITTFYKSIDEARQGSDKTQEALGKLGITFDMLKTATPEAMLQTAAEKLAGIEDPAQKTAMAIDIFGKAMIGVNPAKFAEELGLSTAEFEKQAAAIQRAAELNDQFEKSMTKIRLAFLEAFGPMISGFSKLLELLGKFPIVIEAITIALLSIPGMFIARGVVSGLSFIAKGLDAVRKSAKTAKDAVDKVPKPGSMKEALLEQQNTTIAQTFRNKASVVGGVGAVGAGIIASAVGDRPSGAGAEDPEAIKKQTENAVQIGKELQGQLNAVQGLADGYRRAAQANMDRLTTEVELLGKSKEEQDLIKATADINKRYADQTAALEEKRKGAKGVTLALINKEIANLKDLQTSELDILNITNDQVRAYARQQQEVKNILDYMEQMAQAQADIAGFASTQDAARTSAFEQVKAQSEALTLTTQREQLEKGILNLRGSDQESIRKLFDLEQQRKTQLEAIQKIQNLPFEGVGGMQQRLQEINDLYDQRRAKIEETMAATKAEQDSFGYGWIAAGEKFRNNIKTDAEYAAQQMQSFTKGFEDAFVKFVQTGKLSFKDLINSMIADFARMQAQKMLNSLLSGAGPGGSFFGSIGKLFGFANGGMPPVNRPSIVGERGPELFVPQSAGRIIPNHALGMGQPIVNNNSTAVTYNIQAVDASSFRSLIARDPEFIHNVSEQGRRQMPIRSRR